jgi:hypothetical protein
VLCVADEWDGGGICWMCGCGGCGEDPGWWRGDSCKWDWCGFDFEWERGVVEFGGGG